MAIFTREFLKGLKLEDDIVDKIMSESSKTFNALNQKVSEHESTIGALTTQLNTLKNEKTTLETQVLDLEKNKGDAVVLQKTIDDLKDEIAKGQAKELDRIRNENLNARFTKAIGEKKFVNDFTKNGLFAEFKAALEKPENEGKADDTILAVIVADREGIFTPEHNFDGTPGLGGGAGAAITKEMFEKMPLLEKMKLANTNPAEYERLSKL
ncbi:MAG: phage scaffolding protein [Clostridia bacterium]|nr:phage scaffolding protein [Clostridia bacterium]